MDIYVKYREGKRYMNLPFLGKNKAAVILKESIVQKNKINLRINYENLVANVVEKYV